MAGEHTPNSLGHPYGFCAHVVAVTLSLLHHPTFLLSEKY
jgi:hypothetical protein